MLRLALGSRPATVSGASIRCFCTRACQSSAGPASSGHLICVPPVKCKHLRNGQRVGRAQAQNTQGTSRDHRCNERRTSNPPALSMAERRMATEEVLPITFVMNSYRRRCARANGGSEDRVPRRTLRCKQDQVKVRSISSFAERESLVAGQHLGAHRSSWSINCHVQARAAASPVLQAWDAP